MKKTVYGGRNTNAMKGLGRKHLWTLLCAVIAIGLGLALCAPATALGDTTVTSGKTKWTGTMVVNSNVTVESRVTVSGEVTLVLNAGTTLTVPEGIFVTTGNKLTITGSGTLNAGSETPMNQTLFCAGIGGGWANYSSSAEFQSVTDPDCGTIIINGGTINAWGNRGVRKENNSIKGGFSAGIGGGAAYNGGLQRGGSGGTIIINGGTVNAYGYDGGAGIGGGGGMGGNQGGGGTVTINGGTVKAYAVMTYNKSGAGIGSGSFGGACSVTIGGVASVNARSTHSGAGIGGGYMSSSASIVINGNATVEAESYNGGAGIGGGSCGESGSIVIEGSAVVEAESRWGGASIGGGYHSGAGNVLIRGNAEVTATSAHAESFAGGAGIGGGNCNSDDGGVVHVLGGKITIEGGTVNVTGGEYAPGIGSGSMGDGATIIIKGGNVNATGGTFAAGIGGGLYGDGGTITINGGTVTATSGNHGAGIGGGWGGNGGNITIKGGTVNAAARSSDSKGQNGAGIGGGGRATLESGISVGGNGGTTTIEGGTITASSESHGAGIGGGNRGSGGKIIIKGGSIVSTGGDDSADIGGGRAGNGGDIEISGGDVDATSYNSRRSEACTGIGCGKGGSIGTIRISGGTIRAHAFNDDFWASGMIGDVELSFTPSTCSNMSVYSNDYIGTVTFAKGQAFTNGDTLYSGTYEENLTKDFAYEYITPFTGVTVNVADGQQDRVSVDRHYAAVGQTINVTVKLDDDWGLNKLIYIPTGGQAIEIPTEGGRGSFTAPEQDVLIEAVGGRYFSHADKINDIIMNGDLTEFPDVEWSVTVNPDYFLNTAGMKLRAFIDDDSSQYIAMDGSDGLTVSYRNIFGNTAVNRKVDWNSLEGYTPTSWSFDLGQTFVTSYQKVFTFRTTVNTNQVLQTARPKQVGIHLELIDENDSILSSQYLTCKLKYAGKVYYLDKNRNEQICENYTFVTDDSLEWNTGWYVLNDDVSLEFNQKIMVNGDVHLILCDGVGMWAEKGIKVPDGSSLTIYAQSASESSMGRLSGGPIGGGSGPFSGTHDSPNSGNITINGGRISATSNSGAGIGCGNRASACGRIEINGGIIKAVSGGNGAGIGSGTSTTPGEIIITGGVVYGESKTLGAGIGSGCDAGCSKITITGGKVTGVSQSTGTGIGCGLRGNGGNITISGGTVIARSYGGGTGIGTGAPEYGGTTILTWTDASHDSISVTASSFKGTVKLEKNFKSISGNVKALFAATDNADTSLLNDVTLVPFEGDIYSVNCSQSRHVTVMTNYRYAEPGDRIVVSFTNVEEGYSAYRLEYKHDKWYRLNPDENGEYAFIMPAGDVTVYADFRTLIPISFNNGGGSGEKPTEYAPTDERYYLPAADTFTPPKGMHFKEWSIIRYHDQGLPNSVMAGKANEIIILNAIEVVITAVYEPDLYAINLSAENGSLISDKQEALPGETVTLTLVPDDDYSLASLRVQHQARPSSDPLETIIQQYALRKMPDITVNWTGENTCTFEMPNSGVIVKAVFTPSCLVSFVDWNGEILWQEEMQPDETPIYPGVPVRWSNDQYSYDFAGWEPEVSPVPSGVSAVTYQAVYTETLRNYSVVFTDWDGQVLQTLSLPYGEIPAYTGQEPTREAETNQAYSFRDWTPWIMPITEDTVYTASYDAIPVLTAGQNTVSLERYETLPTLFTPTADGYYRFRSERGPARPIIRICYGEEVLARDIYWSGGDYTFDCVAELKGGRTYTVNLVSYECDAEVVVDVTSTDAYEIALDGNLAHGEVVVERLEGRSTACEGTWVYVAMLPEEGYWPAELIVTDENGRRVDTVDDASFIMPASDVTISARFEEMFPVTTVTDGHPVTGIISMNGRIWDWEDAWGFPDSTVEMMLFVDEGYEVSSVTVTGTDGRDVPCSAFQAEGNDLPAYWFVMPDVPVTVRVTQTELPPAFGTATFTLPSGILTVEGSAFEGDRSITAAEIPENCRFIGKRAFKDCANLKKIRIPENCEIGTEAFEGCTDLYIYGKTNSPAYFYCQRHNNCRFVEE